MEQSTENVREFPVPPRQQDEIVVVNSPDDVDYNATRPLRLTAAILRDAPEEIPDYKLHQLSTRLGYTVTARVRLVNLTDRMLLTDLPTGVRELAQRLFFSGAANQTKKLNKMAEMENTSKRIREVARAYGCAGFLDPKLVLDERDEDLDNNILHVDRIPLHDLQEFMRICEGDDQLAERRLQRFPE